MQFRGIGKIDVKGGIKLQFGRERRRGERVSGRNVCSARGTRGTASTPRQ